MMRNLLSFSSVILFLLLTNLGLNAQVIFSEDFDGIPGPTAGGAGTYSFPAGWFLRNVDNRTPAAQVAYVNEAWERREDFAHNVADSCAFSTSWYSPAGAADDWMWTPAIALPTGSSLRLNWNAVSYDPDYPDGYEVRIMTVAPTGGTGVIGNMVSASTVLFSTTAESNSWTSHSVNLDPSYQGKTVYIGFRNNTTDKFILAIDDIVVESAVQHDASLTAANSYPYTAYPYTQNPVFNLGGTIQNAGSNSITNLNLNAKVYQGNNPVPVQSTTGTVLASLAAGGTATFNCGTYSALSPGLYTVKYYPQMTETDDRITNDTITRSFVITDSTMARDDSQPIGSLGIGAGNGGYMGQSFTLTAPADLSSVFVFYTRGYTGRKYGCVLWNTTVAGVPNAIIAATDTLLYPDDLALADDIPMHGGKVSLAAGTYVVTAIEFDSTLALANTKDIFTSGTTWINWPTSPAGAWANAESFGTSFARSFVLRLNLHSPGVLPVKLVAFTGTKVNNGNKLDWKVSDQTGIKEYVLERGANGREFSALATINASSLSSSVYAYTDAAPLYGNNFYRLKIEDGGRTTYSSIVKMNGDKYNTSLSPQPATDFAVLQSGNTKLLNTEATLVNSNGTIVRKIMISSLPLRISVNSLPSGMYILKLQDNSMLKLLKQ